MAWCASPSPTPARVSRPKPLREVRRRLAPSPAFPVEQLNARDKRQVVALARKHQVDLIMNAVDPLFGQVIFDAAYTAGCHYIDMAMTLSRPHPERPYEVC